MKNICIVGIGGFAREALCCLIDSMAFENPNFVFEDNVCFMIKDEDIVDQKIMGINVIPQSSFDHNLYDVFVAIGEPNVRQKVVQSLPKETTYLSIIHPSAVISKWVEIGEGSIVTAGTVITCNVKIGKHAHLNLNTTIGHDCVIDDFFTTAPGTNISGICKFGKCVYFGTNTAVKQGINICDYVTIGMGGVVVKHINEQGVYIGSPVKKMI